MNLMDKITRKFRRFAIPNLMIYITGAMLAVFAVELLLQFPLSAYLSFSRKLILAGEFWRVISFIVTPPNNSALWILISLYFYYIIGTSLESYWGTTHFTLYYFFGIIGAIIAGFITGTGHNFYLNLSLFLAYASLFPNEQILLFFFLPVKAKYIGYLNWAIIAISFISGGASVRVSILFSLINYFIFFGPDIFRTIKCNIKHSKRRREFKRDMYHNRDIWK